MNIPKSARPTGSGREATPYARPTQLVVFALPVTKVLLRDWGGHRDNVAHKRKTTTGLRAGVKKPPAFFWIQMEVSKICRTAHRPAPLPGKPAFSKRGRSGNCPSVPSKR
jgi:hypothetical protein